MPRSINEYLTDAEAEALADMFERYEPSPDDEIDVRAHNELREAAFARASAEVRVAEAVVGAREGNMSWGLIGAILGTSGEAARQRYGALVKPGVAKRARRTT